MKIYSKEELNNYNQSLTYDDISLVPTEISKFKSRSECESKSNFLGHELVLPVLASPMDAVTGVRMAKALSESGCIGIVNRFDSSLDEILHDSENENNIKAVSVGLQTSLEDIEKFASRKLLICIDTANANNLAVLKKCEEIKSRVDVKLIVGNIAHGATLTDLVNAGADAVRIGIGGGSMCTTSIQTGIGIGQVSSLLNVYFEREKQNVKIELIADGGIKSAGDVAKAMALGADIVMLGRMLAGTKETPGEVIKYNDQLWKKYRGSASFGVKMKGEFIEGEETMVPYKGLVGNIINNIHDGLRSSMSYMNKHTIEEVKQTDTFALLSNSSYLERLPRK